VTGEHTDDEIPDHVLEEQAWSEGLTPKRAGTPKRGPMPHDADCEVYALGAMMLSTEAAAASIEGGLEPEHFYAKRHQAIFRAICEVVADDGAPEALAVGLQLGWSSEQCGTLIEMVAAAPSTKNVMTYVRRIVHLARMRDLIANASDLISAAQADDLPRALSMAERLHAPAEDPLSPAIAHQSLGAFLDSDEPTYDWVIEGLLERTDRILLTGPEGGGKSTLLRQIAVMTAAGIHPFTHQPIEPLRVILLDLENSAAHIRRKLTDLRAKAEWKADATLEVAPHPQGLDLTDPTDVASLTHLIATVQPDLVVGGPIYKLVGGDPTAEEPAKAAAMVLDRLRTAHGFALALETHQPHGSGNERPERPYGASLWKRWPEFGLHIGSNGQLRHWRGARDEREWPAALQRGIDWPWEKVEDPTLVNYARIKATVREFGRRMSEREIASILGASKSTVHRAIEANKADFEAACKEFDL
jgi:hypothetical protein